MVAIKAHNEGVSLRQVLLEINKIIGIDMKLFEHNLWSSSAIKAVDSLPGVGEWVVAAEVVAGLGIVVVNEVWVHVVHPIIHDGRGHIKPGNSLGPGRLHVEI